MKKTTWTKFTHKIWLIFGESVNPSPEDALQVFQENAGIYFVAIDSLYYEFPFLYYYLFPLSRKQKANG